MRANWRAPSAALRPARRETQRSSQRRGQDVDLTLGTLPNQVEAKADNDNDRGGPDEGFRDSAARPHLGARGPVAGAGKEGVVVTDVDHKSPAAERGFKEGDVILEVGGKSVATRARSVMRSPRRAMTARTAC